VGVAAHGTVEVVGGNRVDYAASSRQSPESAAGRLRAAESLDFSRLVIEKGHGDGPLGQLQMDRQSSVPIASRIFARRS
jgi:hypothetical protein